MQTLEKAPETAPLEWCSLVLWGEAEGEAREMCSLTLGTEIVLGGFTTSLVL